MSVPLWIDALSINQRDIPEKNMQVTQMGYIYARAKEIIVWLGQSNEVLEDAFDLLSWFAEDDADDESESDAENSALALRRRCWNMFDVIESLPYWSRTWTVQESVLAKYVTLWCGARSISFEVLQQLYGYIRTQPGPPGTGRYIGTSKTARSTCGYLTGQRCIRSEVRRENTMDVMSFPIAAARLRYQGCFDKRDRVYALRATDPGLRDLPVDYAQHAAYLLL